MFLGSYTCKLDQKYRFRIPTSFREELEKNSSGICLYKGIDGCYILSTKEDFMKLISELSKINSINPDKKLQMAKRLILQFYKDLDEDSQGRCVLPKAIREDQDFNFDGELLFSGMGTHIEIWSKSKYEKMYENISYDDALLAIQNMNEGNKDGI